MALARIPKPFEEEGTDGSDGETIDVDRERFPGPQRQPLRHEYEAEIARLYERIQNSRFGPNQERVKRLEHIKRLELWEKGLMDLEDSLRNWSESLKISDRKLRDKEKLLWDWEDQIREAELSREGKPSREEKPKRQGRSAGERREKTDSHSEYHIRRVYHYPKSRS
jgi:hypothetical protein